MRLKETMMHSNAHVFAPKSEGEIAFSNHTMAHISREMAQEPSSDASFLNRHLKTRLGEKKAQWDEWIVQKKQPLPTEAPA